MPKQLTAVLSLGALLIVIAPATGLRAQTTPDSDAAATQAASIVPQQVRYAARLPARAGDTVEAVFRIYSVPEGGEPIWTETQRISVGEDGAYTVLLGSATPAGLPQTVFAGGAARWLGVSVERGPEQDRVLLSSVPYAMKSADAESLAGHAASDFVTQSQLAALALPPSQPGPAPHGALPETGGDVTGSGTLNTVPLWNSTATIGDSVITQSGTSIGINQPTPASALDVNGGITVRGDLNLPAPTKATASKGQSSNLFEFSSSAWSSTANAAQGETFFMVADPTGNNSASPSAVLNFQFKNGTAAPVTVFSVAGNGVMTFSPSQTFPGTITSIAATGPITASTTSGATTVGINETTLASDITPSLETTFNGIYPQLTASNTFTTGQVIEGASAIIGTSESGSMLTVSNNGDSFSTAASLSNVGQYGTGLSASASNNGFGIEGFGTQTGGSIGILGALANSGGFSNSFNLLESDDGLDSGVWADGATGQKAALIATGDDVYGGIFYNDSATSSTIIALNNNSNGNTGLVAGIGTVIRAGGPAGICGINQAGNLACTGQMKAVLSTRDGARQVETYTVQSAENWVEDYGSGQLQHGAATIQIEPAFAQTVNTGVGFHVFLTPGGDCKGLYVTNKSAGSFEVHELGGGTSSIPFDYKIVAKRSGLEGQRLVDVTDRMRVEAENARLKQLDHPLPRRRPAAPLARTARAQAAATPN